MRCHGTKCPLLMAFFGPSGVHALPLAAGINEGGHYFRYFSSSLFLSAPLTFLSEGVIVGF